MLTSLAAFQFKHSIVLIMKPRRAKVDENKIICFEIFSSLSIGSKALILQNKISLFNLINLFHKPVSSDIILLYE